MTYDVLDRKLNKENQICNFSSFFNEKALTHTKHTYMWVKSKNTTSCMQQNASTEYKSATNKAKQLYKAF
jgi:hypothetical protein